MKITLYILCGLTMFIAGYSFSTRLIKADKLGRKFNFGWEIITIIWVINYLMLLINADL